MSEKIPPGFYNAVAVPVDTDDGKVWAQFGEAKNGTPQVLLHFKILDGEYQGYQLPWFGYFKKDSMERTLKSLRYAGFRGDDLTDLPEQPLDLKVSITVEHQEFDGKTYARVAWVNRPGGAGVKLASPMKGDKLRNFAAQMRRHAQQVPEIAGERADGNGAPSTAPPQTADGHPVTDEIPF